MKRFKTFVAEGKYPIWVRVTVAGLTLKIRNHTNRKPNRKGKKHQRDNHL